MRALARLAADMPGQPRPSEAGIQPPGSAAASTGSTRLFAPACMQPLQNPDMSHSKTSPGHQVPPFWHHMHQGELRWAR